MISGLIGMESEESIPETLKETVIILAAIMVAPYLYQVFASLCNRISEIPIQSIDFGGFFASVISAIAVGSVLGVFSSFFGFYAGALAVGLLLSNLTAMVRIFIIKGLLLAFPFIVLLYLFPVTRNTAQSLISILAGLCFAGPVAAFVIAGMCTTVGPLATFLAPTFAYVFFPYMLSLATGASPATVASGITKAGLVATSGAVAKTVQNIKSDLGTGLEGVPGSSGYMGTTFVKPGRSLDFSAASVSASLNGSKIAKKIVLADLMKENTDSRLAGLKFAVKRVKDDADHYRLLTRAYLRGAAGRVWNLAQPAGREFLRSTREGFEAGTAGFRLGSTKAKVSRPEESIMKTTLGTSIEAFRSKEIEKSGIQEKWLKTR